MKRAAAGLLLLASFSAAAACEDWLGVPLGSKHGGSDNYREFNPGIGFEHRCGRFGIGGGIFRNSLDRTAIHFGVGATALDFGALKIRVLLLAASGYGTKAGYVAVPMVSYEGKKYGMDFLVVPPIGDRQWVIGYGVKMRF